MSSYISPEAQAMHEAAAAKAAEVELKRKITNAVIFILNFPMLVVILLGLNLIGFVTITPPNGNPDLQSVAAVAVVIALFFMVIRKLADSAYKIVLLVSCLTALIFYPLFNILVGYVSLWVVSHIVPSVFQLSGNVLYGILAGLAIGVGQIPSVDKHSAPKLESEAEQAEKAAKKKQNSVG